MTNETPAQRLGRLVRARRKELRKTQADVQNAGGPSTATLRLIEGGKHTEFRDGTGAALEAALRWGVGSIDRILAGGEPNDIRRPISIHMLEEDPQDEIARTTSAALERVGRDGDVEVERQVQLLNGVRTAWKLAPLAAKLGCNPAEIRDFTHAGFGLLMGSGVLGLIATYKDELAKVMSEFTEADQWGPNAAQPQPEIDLAFPPIQTNEENHDDLENEAEPNASPEGNEGEEDGEDGDSQLDIAFAAVTPKLFSDADEEVMADSTRTLHELFQLLGTIDSSFDLSAELDELHRELAPIRDQPAGMLGILKGESNLLQRARDSMLAYIDAAEMDNTVADVEAATVRKMLAQVEGHLRAYLPAHAGNVVRPPTLEGGSAASQGYKQADDLDDAAPDFSEFGLAARATKPGYRKGQAEHGVATGDEPES